MCFCYLRYAGIRCIATFLKKNNHPIEMLSLCSNNIGDKGASVIVDALKDNNKINQLSLSQCGISAKGIQLCVCVCGCAWMCVCVHACMCMCVCD